MESVACTRLAPSVAHEDIYVLDLAHNSDKSSICASLSTLGLAMLDALTLQRTSTIERAHKSRINDIQYSKVCPSLLLSTSDDEYVHIWDTRSPRALTGEASLSLKMDGEVESACLGFNDRLIVITNAHGLVFQDIRMANSPLVVGRYDDVHTEAVNSVCFHPTHEHLLYSSGEDGLIGVYDISQAAGQQALVAALNTETPISKVAFFGAEQAGLSCLSTMETASLWHYQSAQRLMDLPKAREAMNSDYLLGIVESTLGNDGPLLIVGGTHDGQLKISNIYPTRGTSGTPLLKSSDDSSASRQHDSTIRTMLYASYGVLMTGAEDGKICCWKFEIPPS